MADFVLECRKVSHWFGRQKVLHDVNLRIPRGQFVGLVGPSGCGKSTLLRAMLGTHPPCAGQVLMNGEAVLRPSRDRGIVYRRVSAAVPSLPRSKTSRSAQCSTRWAFPAGC